MYYVLIGLCLTLAGVAGLQLTYMFYLDRLDRERKRRLQEIERKCLRLTAKLADAEKVIAEQEIVIDTLYSEASEEEPWAEVLDES